MTTSQSFTQALMEYRIKKGPSCTLGVLLERLNPEQRAEIETAMNDQRIQSTAIAFAIETAGYGKLPAQGISRHRKHDCACPR